MEIDNGPVLRESDSVQPGSEMLPPFDTDVGKVGALICFDLRFAEPAISLRRQGATMITYPSAFTVKTGQAHWTIQHCSSLHLAKKNPYTRSNDKTIQARLEERMLPKWTLNTKSQTLINSQDPGAESIGCGKVRERDRF